ncbi:arf-GAP with Rho-GAP domain, ANK repeat and PH domain-containing protein 2 [Acipenser ruthenus]|uniref:arf-GAP with Rho-GAP domain, ANK repeat and PH domain-containing protein 2 n=1 Tax=Acipenser ruthenus TaxID=7906 RepID=UPI00274231EB|nr:arf-GAP with Rho-GAP domain, ANK repeat and PH domain-containing protein 2 [Acipenser ruthenus]
MMSSSTDTGEDIRVWLESIHLQQYIGGFIQAGYHTLEDCANLNNEVLLHIGVTPTGHRKRILNHLQSLPLLDCSDRVAVDESETKATPAGTGGYDSSLQTRVSSEKIGGQPTPKTRTIYSKGRNAVKGAEILSKAQDDGHYIEPYSQSHNIEAKSADLVCGSQTEQGKPQTCCIQSEPPFSSLSSLCPISENEHSFEEPIYNPFKGKMVVNELYSERTDLVGQAPMQPVSRSFKLRHRPVPQIPFHTVAPLEDKNLLKRRNAELSSICNVQNISNAALQKASLEFTPSPICPYGETFLYNSPGQYQENSPQEMEEQLQSWKLCSKESDITDSQDKAQTQQKDTSLSKEDYSDLEYSTVKWCSRTFTRRSPDRTKYDSFTLETFHQTHSHHSAYSMGYSLPCDVVGARACNNLPARIDSEISPYACYYGSSKRRSLKGWLDKLSPQGKCVFQKRWVKFDGENLSYFNNDKEMYSKGLIPLSAINTVRPLGDSKFEVVTSHRTFVFRVEKEGDRHDWINTLLIALRTRSRISQGSFKRTFDRCGYLELRGHKGKIFMVLVGTKVRLCKNEQDFKSGLAITVIGLDVTTVNDLERKCFELNTPFRNFCFAADSEREKQEWIEAVQESIAETLSDYEVAEKIWFNESNRSCADCCAPKPEWASINLCVVICKKCAAQHRSLGSNISKVRSLKLDTSIWNNELVELFLVVGNRGSNSFWAANLPQEEQLDSDGSPEQRNAFIVKKYRDRKFRKILSDFVNQEQLNQALCVSVLQQDVLETMSLVFSGADVMCATGDPIHCTPYLLAQTAGHRLQMEFLYHNKLSDFPKLDPVYERRFNHDASSFMHGFLYEAVNIAKSFTEKKLKDDMSKRWCTLEGGFLSYYENDKTATPNGRIDISEVVCLAVDKTEYIMGVGAIFTFEIYLLSERAFLFGTQTTGSQSDWAQAIAKHFIPSAVENLSEKDYELIGRLYYKEGRNLYHWGVGWFALDKSCLYFCDELDRAEVESLQLKRLQELTVSTQLEGGERIDVLLLVESGRTLYIHGNTKLDFMVWYSAIQKAAGTNSNALPDQQLSKNDIPIIVESCIAFVTQYGLCYEGIYQKNGNPALVAQLLERFRKDARNVKLRAGQHQLEDVTDVLKCFLFKIYDALLTKELYPYWISVLDLENKKGRIEKYTTFIRSLPRVNRTTLSALIGHLYRVQKCSNMNQMCTHNLALVFSSCLFQTEGQTSQEVTVIEDLINNYAELFDVNEYQVKQMEIENRFITKLKDTLYSQAGDIIIEVYLERKVPEHCLNVKVSPTMKAEELADCVLEMKRIVPDQNDVWTTFEAIENGELERPLHYREKVLEQVLEWSSLEEPGSAFLIIKNVKAANVDRLLQGNTKGFIKSGYMKFKEGPSKLLSGNKFQDRYFILRDEKLLQFRDIKSTKPEKEISVKSFKFYLGLKKRLKPPTCWGFTIYTEKQQWYLCCDGQDIQMEWMMGILRVQNGDDLWSLGRTHHLPVEHKSPKVGGVSFIPAVQQQNIGEMNVKQIDRKSDTCNAEGSCEEDANASLKQKASLVADCLKQKEASTSSVNIVKPNKRTRGYQAYSDPSRNNAKHGIVRDKSPLNMSPNAMYRCEAQLPPSLLQELNTVLSKNNRGAKKK